MPGIARVSCFETLLPQVEISFCHTPRAPSWALRRDAAQGWELLHMMSPRAGLTHGIITGVCCGKLTQMQGLPRQVRVCGAHDATTLGYMTPSGLLARSFPLSCKSLYPRGLLGGPAVLGRGVWIARGSCQCDGCYVSCWAFARRAPSRACSEALARCAFAAAVAFCGIRWKGRSSSFAPARTGPISNIAKGGG